MLSIYLIRHPEVEHSGEGVFAGNYDIPLSRQGRTQISQIAEYGKKLNLTAIISSPLSRAENTARALSAATGLPVMLEPRLKEIDFGRWEGIKQEEASRIDPDLYAEYGRADMKFRFPEGEGLEEFKARVTGCLGDIVDRHRSETAGGSLAVITHAGAIRMILLDLLKIDFPNIWRFKIDYASINLLEYEGGYTRIGFLNNLSHLVN